VADERIHGRLETRVRQAVRVLSSAPIVPSSSFVFAEQGRTVSTASSRRNAAVDWTSLLEDNLSLLVPRRGSCARCAWRNASNCASLSLRRDVGVDQANYIVPTLAGPSGNGPMNLGTLQKSIWISRVAVSRQVGEYQAWAARCVPLLRRPETRRKS